MAVSGNIFSLYEHEPQLPANKDEILANSRAVQIAQISSPSKTTKKHLSAISTIVPNSPSAIRSIQQSLERNEHKTTLLSSAARKHERENKLLALSKSLNEHDKAKALTSPPPDSKLAVPAASGVLPSIKLPSRLHQPDMVISGPLSTSHKISRVSSPGHSLFPTRPFNSVVKGSDGFTKYQYTLQGPPQKTDPRGSQHYHLERGWRHSNAAQVQGATLNRGYFSPPDTTILDNLYS